jgi:hypothetical protein
LLCQGPDGAVGERLALVGNDEPVVDADVRPNPRQVAHAPSGELKEKVLGTGSE